LLCAVKPKPVAIIEVTVKKSDYCEVITVSVSSLIKKYFRLALFMGITCLLIAIPMFAQAQVNNLNSSIKASVVIDGEVVFQVGKFGEFSAHERAEQINQALIDTLNSSTKIDIDLVTVDGQVTIKNVSTHKHLLTVTQADVISAANSYNQALLWKNKIQKTLDRSRQERTTAYQSKAFLAALLAAFLAIAISLGIQFLRSFIYRRTIKFYKKQRKTSSWHKFISPWCQFLLFTFQLGIWLYTFIYITNLFPQTRSWRYWLNSPLINFNSQSYSALELLLLLGLTIATWFVARTITNLLKDYILKKTISEPAIQDVIAVFLRYIFTALSLIILWQSWGIDVGTLAIPASVLGVGIGFGLQNIVNNFISGLILTIERPIKVGDLIKVDDLIGTVKNIGSRSTEILTTDHLTIIVPNAQLLDNQLINWNHRNPISRLRIPVGVSYNSELRRVKTALLYAAKSHSEVLSTPRPQILFQRFNDSSLDFELLVWIKDPNKQFRITSDLNYLIMSSFKRYKIDIPFPQADVNHSSPKLEKLFSIWLASQGINSHLLQETVQNNSLGMTDGNNNVALSLDSFEDKLNEIDLDELVIAMRGENGLEILDRRYHLSFFPTCFVGCKAIDWIVEREGYQREQAVELGQMLVERGIIHHVTDEHPFQDSYLFYRFYADE